MKRHPGATFIYNCHANFAAVPRLADVTNHVTALEAIGLVGYWYRFLLGGFYHFAHNDDLAGKTAQEPMVAEFEKQFQLPVTGQHPEIQVAPAVREKVLGLLRQKNLDPARLVLLHPGPSWTIKEWPREHWMQLVAGLRAAGFTDIAQLGVGRYLYFGQVELTTIPGAVSLVDELSVEECFAAIGQAKLFIGIDSGLLHIAAAMRTPSVGIFGPTSPQFFYPEAVRAGFAVSGVECQGCYHRRPRVDWVTGCPNDIRCMKEISVELLLKSCLKKLSTAGK
jgi:ADP-heptose:LPS heptosyltransferase